MTSIISQIWHSLKSTKHNDKVAELQVILISLEHFSIVIKYFKAALI